MILFHPASEPLQPRRQSQIVQDRRTQFLSQRAREFDRFVEQILHLADLLLERTGLAVATQEVEVELGPKEHLLEMVMEDLRQPPPLPLLGLAQLHSQGPQLGGALEDMSLQV